MHLPKRVSKPGPLLDYLMFLHDQGLQSDPALSDHAKATVNAVKRVLATPDGQTLMDLLQKATTDYFISQSADSRALDALNAQRFIALDLQRIASDEIQAVLDQRAHARSSNRDRDRR